MSKLGSDVGACHSTRAPPTIPDEPYISSLTRKALTPNDFATPEALRTRIREFERRRNRSARPIRWRFDRADLDKLMLRWAGDGVRFESASVSA